MYYSFGGQSSGSRSAVLAVNIFIGFGGSERGNGGDESEGIEFRGHIEYGRTGTMSSRAFLDC